MSSRFGRAGAHVRIARASLAGAGAGALRVALLFSSAAIAFALILAPVLERKTRQNALFSTGIDAVTTSSVSEKGGVFTVRRSVLQASPEAVCIIRADGSRHGAC